MVAAATLFIAILAASSQAIAAHNHGRSLHDASHHHIAVARDYVSPNVASPLAKRHESNKKRTNNKRARRCKPKPKAPAADPTSSSKKPDPTQNTPVKDKDDPTPPPPKSTPKADPPKADPPSNRAFAQHTGGDGTFYAPGLNACGTVDKDSDFIAAVSHEMFDTFPGATANPNNNPICGRKVRATFNGKSVVVKITDKCMGCDIYTSLDFSPPAFNELSTPDVGRFHGLSWEFI